MDNMDVFVKQHERYLTAWAMSKAILEDYSIVISKIENVSKEEIQERILKKTKEHFTLALQSIPKP